MIETSKNRWELQGPKGNTISENIPVNSKTEAEEWIKAYISSFTGWEYAMLPKENK